MKSFSANNLPLSVLHRVLQLEKINTSLHADIQRRDDEMKEVKHYGLKH